MSKKPAARQPVQKHSFLARPEPGTARYSSGSGWPGTVPQAGCGPPPQPGRPPGPARKKLCPVIYKKGKIPTLTHSGPYLSPAGAPLVRQSPRPHLSVSLSASPILFGSAPANHAAPLPSAHLCQRRRRTTLVSLPLLASTRHRSSPLISQSPLRRRRRAAPLLQHRRAAFLRFPYCAAAGSSSGGAGTSGGGAWSSYRGVGSRAAALGAAAAAREAQAAAGISCHGARS
jgi:hypothetical protein